MSTDYIYWGIQDTLIVYVFVMCICVFIAMCYVYLNKHLSIYLMLMLKMPTTTPPPTDKSVLKKHSEAINLHSWLFGEPWWSLQ